MSEKEKETERMRHGIDSIQQRQYVYKILELIIFIDNI
jgi:hypothetical protein